MSLTHYRPKRTSYSFVNLRYKGSSLFLFPSVSSNEAAFEKVLSDNLIIMIYFYSLIYSYIIRYFEGHGLKYNHSNTSFKMTSKLDREIASRRVASQRRYLNALYRKTIYETEEDDTS